MMEAPKEPSFIGRYEIVGKLAQGGMAEILLGRLSGPSGFERSVVIKRILPTFADERSFVDMFLDEARIAARINHPNVIRIQELCQEDHELYVVMEYLEGESLASVQRRARSRRVEIGFDQAATIVAEAAAGLHAAHEMTDVDGMTLGIVHRDISPQNLFVTYDGGVKVIDFGIAKAADRITVTEAGSLKGKFAYMSPEQASGASIDRRSDIFSLGIVLYELTTGRTLFRRATRLASLRAVTDVDIVPPSRLVEGYPRDLERVCSKALAADPKDRYQDAESMRADLLAAMRGLSADSLPERRLKETMHALFADRISDKREMLRKVSAGHGVSHIPSAEVDRDVELPSVVLDVEVQPARRKRIPMMSIAAVALVAVAIAIGGLSLLARSTDATEESAPRSTSPTESTNAEDMVSVRVESEPVDAHVLVDGQERGMTPATVTLARSHTAVQIRLELAGHEPLTTDVVPDVDQRLRLSLRPEARRAPRRRRRSAAARSEMAEPPEPTMEPEFPRFN